MRTHMCVEGSYFRFIAGIGGTEARDDCRAGVAIK